MATQHVWMFWRRPKSFTPTGIRIAGHQAYGMVAMLNTQTMLLWVHAAHIHQKLDDAGILLHEVMEMHNLPLNLVQMHYPSHTFESLRSL